MCKLCDDDAKYGHEPSPANDSNDRLDYVARFPGMPGYGAWCVDDPNYKKDTANTLAGWIQRGATIERVTRDVANAGMLEYLEAKKAKKKLKENK